ncbi:flagellar motor protein MotB [Pectinatus cerevisiiphilus]|uniref:Chemotaxis protein MotB n=1 Tax=Pectinatus cerevisiiphilus TaxID=86956 RepID=A0A4V2USC3_9FIRM|nr:flagellar motor protein MotB [Pectinatus cerevisiiphilus]TCS80882.1 chemotaxis protein MotB [Pectinatus cerevisiiphilus]
MARKKRAKPKEDHPSEAWLLPYSDLMTLLLALFIVLYAINAASSKTNSEDVTATFRHGFNAGGISFFDKMGSQNGYTAYLTEDQSKEKSVNNYVAENDKLEKERAKLEAYIKENNLQNEVSTQLTEQGLMVRIKEKALFPSGSADLTNDSDRITTVVASVLGSVKENVTISGYTDNVPIANSRYPSNWELSSQRALNFMKGVFAKNPQLDPARFQATGYSEYHPIVPNDTPENRAQNRRVEVLIARSYSSSEMQTIK